MILLLVYTVYMEMMHHNARNMIIFESVAAN